MKVLKFGGTSLGDPQRMKRVAEIVSQQGKVLVVLSAVAGTTDSLVKIVDALKSGNSHVVDQTITELEKHYQLYITQLFSCTELIEEAVQFVSAQLFGIRELVQQRFIDIFEYQVLARGELISTEIFHLYLNQSGQNSMLIPALNILRLDQNNLPDESYLSDAINKVVAASEGANCFVTQGFICRNAFGEVYNLRRGGSDYSASLFGAALNCEEVQIWTDIDGMHNNDPRFVEGTRPIRSLSFNEAAELAYFGAKILHPSSVKPARKKDIPVKLLNTLEPTAPGTVITSKSTKAGIKAIAAKDGITAIKIKSSEMLQAPGFLRRVFEVFELYHTSIDMITTSEVAVSLTIDDITHLDKIIKTLKEFGRVEVDYNQSIICVVGDFGVEGSAIALPVIQCLKDIPIRMISYGGSAHNVSVLVSEELKVKSLNELHRGLFNV